MKLRAAALRFVAGEELKAQGFGEYQHLFDSEK
jgi:hypothetical protein